MFLLVVSPAGYSCDTRKYWAKHFVDQPDDVLDLSCWKLRGIIMGDLDDAARTGKLAQRSWDLISRLAEASPLDTQKVEGVNNMIKMGYKRAPNIQWPLLASRVVLRQDLVHLRTAEDRLDFVDFCSRPGYHEEAQKLCTKASMCQRFMTGGTLAPKGEAEKTPKPKPTKLEVHGARLLSSIWKELGGPLQPDGFRALHFKFSGVQAPLRRTKEGRRGEGGGK
eukprot:5958451-Pyramimonas_sp.AAC.2